MQIFSALHQQYICTKIATTKVEKRLSIKNGQKEPIFYLYLYFNCKTIPFYRLVLTCYLIICE